MKRRHGWAHHDRQWRHPLDVISQWQSASELDPKLIQHRVSGDWRAVLAEARISLFVTREYEHLIMAVRADRKSLAVSYLALPHPSGLAVDRQKGTLYVASTRNPNQIYEFAPVKALLRRKDRRLPALKYRPLVPRTSRYLPGSLYIHDLALIKGRLYAASAGSNAIVELPAEGGFRPVWWPRSIDTANGPWFGQNQIQLNSIAAGRTIQHSFFTASSDGIAARRPGHRNYPVDGRGILLSGRTRQTVARGLTRPHSARLHQGEIWINNSGYGELGRIKSGTYVPFVRLPGWTRGLCFWKHIAFVGTSRVIARFRQYAPGLRESESVCGVHAVDTRSGKILGSMIWPSGNQVFGIDWLPSATTSGFPFSKERRPGQINPSDLFYAFSPQ